ncbi:4Fe-4S dicluster domain-containing protein [Pectinatus haikarae]|uniref:Ferredoxin n=1 Tax=Pectinatus haikarae TaxID=349096 RepID=A0ABT9YBV0_9FIRM|nr:ferredoxin family protein [Pectinatus haikarae]MDQ0205006.1 adenylylsulfate reductase subunit B [Pectinatus haikarae]
MSITINNDLCIGCGRCSEICPGTLIELTEQHKAIMIYPRDCWGCASCLKECPTGAVSFFLGPDMGGRGAVMHAKKTGSITQWIITKADGIPVVLETDSRAANKY